MHGDGGTIGTAFQCGRRDSIGDGGPSSSCRRHDSTRCGQASTTSTSIIAQPSSATRTKSLTMRSASPWKPIASARPSRRELFELQGQGDLAGILGQRMEFPAAVQLLERAIAQLHINAVRAPQRVFGLEPGAERAQAEVQARHQAVLALLHDLGSRAPAETARIGLDIIDQVEHARGRMFDARCGG